MSVAFKSFVVSLLTGSISQLLTILTLYVSNSKIMALLVFEVVGTVIAYTAQNFVFMGGRNFFSVLLLKWLVSSTMLLFLSYKLLVYLTNMKKIKTFSEELKGKKKVVFDYSIIIISATIVYFLMDLQMRKHYIFNESDNGNAHGLLILGITGALVAYDRLNT